MRKKKLTRSEAKMGNQNARKKDRYHQTLTEIQTLLKELSKSTSTYRRND